jgi:hypothetical protein
MRNKQNSAVFKWVVVGMGICLFFFLTGTNSTNAQPEIDGPLEEGVLAFVDRNHEYHSIPPALISTPRFFLAFMTFSILLGVVIWLISSAKFSKCPSCGRMWTLKPTGKKENRGGRLIFKNWYYEFHCKYCNHKIWKQRSDYFYYCGGG